MQKLDMRNLIPLKDSGHMFNPYCHQEAMMLVKSLMDLGDKVKWEKVYCFGERHTTEEGLKFESNPGEIIYTSILETRFRDKEEGEVAENDLSKSKIFNKFFYAEVRLNHAKTYQKGKLVIEYTFFPYYFNAEEEIYMVEKRAGFGIRILSDLPSEYEPILSIEDLDTRKGILNILFDKLMTENSLDYAWFKEHYSQYVPKRWEEGRIIIQQLPIAKLIHDGYFNANIPIEHKPITILPFKLEIVELSKQFNINSVFDVDYKIWFENHIVTSVGEEEVEKYDFTLPTSERKELDISYYPTNISKGRRFLPLMKLLETKDHSASKLEDKEGKSVNTGVRINFKDASDSYIDIVPIDPTIQNVFNIIIKFGVKDPYSIGLIEIQDPFIGLISKHIPLADLNAVKADSYDDAFYKRLVAFMDHPTFILDKYLVCNYRNLLNKLMTTYLTKAYKLDRFSILEDTIKVSDIGLFNKFKFFHELKTFFNYKHPIKYQIIEAEDGLKDIGRKMYGADVTHRVYISNAMEVCFHVNKRAQTIRLVVYYRYKYFEPVGERIRSEDFIDFSIETNYYIDHAIKDSFFEDDIGWTENNFHICYITDKLLRMFADKLNLGYFEPQNIL